jgi:hypothetical protein
VDRGRTVRPRLVPDRRSGRHAGQDAGLDRAVVQTLEEEPGRGGRQELAAPEAVDELGQSEG